MAIIASSKISVSDYIIEDERGTENPTVFKLRPMDGQQYMGAMAEANIDDDGMMSFSEGTMKRALKHGFVGWENFNDADGKPVKFSQLNFGRLPVSVLTELFAEIIRLSSLEEAEIKNS